MYRGSSFLLSYDYKVHTGAVKIILDEKYDILFDIDCKELNSNLFAEKLFALRDELDEYYKTLRGINVKSEISETLLSKIIMGTSGCVPAFDTYLCKGMKIYKMDKYHFNKHSIKLLLKFYKDNYEKLEEIRSTKHIRDTNILYTQMKILNIRFWQMGKDEIDSKG